MLAQSVDRAQEEVGALVAPGGELNSHRQAVDALAAQAVNARAGLDALEKDQETLVELREQLQTAQTEVRNSRKDTDLVREELNQVRGQATQLAGEVGRLRDVSRASKEEASATAQIVQDVEKKLGPLAELQQISKNTEERMASLNALAEHVNQKIKSLENQKHTVERAVVESNRLNEMIWAMDVQINKLNDGALQVTRTEELIERVEKLSLEVSSQLETGTRARDTFTRDLVKLEGDRTAFAEFVHGFGERLALERKELESFDQRTRLLQTTIGEVEKRMETVATRERLAETLAQRFDHLSKQFDRLHAQADDLLAQQAALDSLQQSLANVDELAKRTGVQYDHLTENRRDLEAVRKELQEVSASHAAASQLGARLSADRAALESFM